MSKRVPVPTNIQKRVRARVDQCIAIASKRYGCTFSPIHIVYKKRGTVAGTANPTSRVVDFNSVLLMENLDDYIHRTVTHEVAHILDHDVNGQQHTYTFFGRSKRSSHGPTWKAMMRLLGGPTSRCHSYDVSRAKVKKANTRSHIWTCKTCGTKMSLGPKRHSKMLTGISKYWMRGCGRHAGYHYDEGDGRPVTPVIGPTPKKRTHTPSPVGGQSKQDLALQLYREYHGLTRSQMIALFVAKLNMTKAGASTYYYNCKKRVS